MSKTLAIVLLLIVLLFFSLVIVGVIDLTPEEPPKAEGLFSAMFLTAQSDCDRSETSEASSEGGHRLTYVLSDSQLDGLGDCTLFWTVANENVGESDEQFRADFTMDKWPMIGGTASLVNFTDSQSRTDISWSTSSSGSPNIAQEGSSGYSNDWPLGAADRVQLVINTQPAVADDIDNDDQIEFEFTIAGVPCVLRLIEAP